MLPSYFKSKNKDFTLIHGDCCEILSQFNFEFDMIFADPPYFLSDGGISVQSGKIVCVDKGEWDKTISQEEIDKNLNSVGGAWREISTGRILSKDRLSDPNTDLYEKVITPGWHRTEIKDSVRCPVCDDLHNILCCSVYSPVPFIYRLREKMATKFWRVSRYFERRLWEKEQKKLGKKGVKK